MRQGAARDPAGRRQGRRPAIRDCWWAGQPRAQLRQLGLDTLLGFVAAYDSGYGHKPDPAPVLAFAKFAGVAPAEVAVVGDSEHDLVAARAAGAAAIGVLSGPVPCERLAPHADALIPSIAELDDWLCSAGSMA